MRQKVNEFIQIAKMISMTTFFWHRWRHFGRQATYTFDAVWRHLWHHRLRCLCLCMTTYTTWWCIVPFWRCMTRPSRCLISGIALDIIGYERTHEFIFYKPSISLGMIYRARCSILFHWHTFIVSIHYTVYCDDYILCRLYWDFACIQFYAMLYTFYIMYRDIYILFFAMYWEAYILCHALRGIHLIQCIEMYILFHVLRCRRSTF